eukprot:s489_g15.t1
MPAKKTTAGEAAPPPLVIIGATEGEDVFLGSPGWLALEPRAGLIMEVCLKGSSFGVDPTEDWVAVGVLEAAGSPGNGWRITGEFLGCENPDFEEELQGVLTEGYLHLCIAEPCDFTMDGPLGHATRVRLWMPSNFDAPYLTKAGKSTLKKFVKKEESSKVPMKRPAARRAPGSGAGAAGPGRGRGAGLKKPRTQPPPPDLGGAIPVSDEEEAEEPGEEGVGEERRTQLREALRQTRERILGGGRTPRVPRGAGEGLSGGGDAANSGRAQGRAKLVAGTSLNPGVQTLLSVAPLAVTNGDTEKLLRRTSHGKKDASTSLLVKAAEQTARDSRERKKKKRRRDKKDGVKQLVKLLGGKKKKSKKKAERRRRRKGKGEGLVKPDPESPDDSGSSDPSSDSYYSDSDDKDKESQEETDLEMEAPLRRRASKEPGSVMTMLVRHAQEQMDRGSLLEGDGMRAGLTTGIKISTYFALLIRPYQPTTTPLLRELYALAQSIDLLRAGKLLETADALASRFIAVHTAMTEGNWQTASQLEMYPLEPIQSASVATMLEAHKHRRLVMKSQGYPGGGRWWPSTPKGKGANPVEKGKKGDLKGRNKGRGKNQNKDQSWGSKGENNAWKENKEEAPKK